MPHALARQFLARHVLIAALTLAAAEASAETTLRVMTLNLWGGGLHEGRSIADSVAAVAVGGADVVALQEDGPGPALCAAGGGCSPAPRGLACRIAAELRYFCHEQRETGGAFGANAVLSRHPIAGPTPSGLGVWINVEGRAVAVFNLHLADAPYQPYQLRRIAYGEAAHLVTADEAVEAAQRSRRRAIDALERDLAGLGMTPAIVAGDLNEPSHRDWTPRAAALDIVPVAVPWPTTRRLEELGFVDAWRAANPDEIAWPGLTWTALPAATETHDRIDFIFARGPDTRIIEAAVIGERRPDADIVSAPWPSDHRAVAATITFGPAAPIPSTLASARRRER